MRFCVDFRRMNDATIKDAHPLPRIDDTLESLHGAQYFTTLDLKSGYWQVPIKEEDKEKTTFRTSSGQLYEFNQLPFGLCNAPATFSRLMDRTLAGLAWNICLYYLDDIIVFFALQVGMVPQVEVQPGFLEAVQHHGCWCWQCPH